MIGINFPVQLLNQFPIMYQPTKKKDFLNFGQLLHIFRAHLLRWGRFKCGGNDSRTAVETLLAGSQPKVGSSTRLTLPHPIRLKNWRRRTDTHKMETVEDQYLRFRHHRCRRLRCRTETFCSRQIKLQHGKCCEQ